MSLLVVFLVDPSVLTANIDVLADGGQLTAPAEATAQVIQQANTGGRNVYTQILRVREVHLLSIWCLIYVGIEVSLGGESSR